jgi:hypothetical protein
MGIEPKLPSDCKDGERGRNRTYNLLIKSQLLCQLSYAPFNNLRRLRDRFCTNFALLRLRWTGWLGGNAAVSRSCIATVISAGQKQYYRGQRLHVYWVR